ncbi:peptide chain release factor N(5)-glutamine methyltransferase [Aestuariirhabdus sp. Z084]|uniref:peptide chain release factor N(5)-glutamine methyltransferase n=1 Tax=Aestuariirhabdus haliotis TaxID=2918751 RepID=UPI00201B40E2|nr:peptide chain release factor N(5)-glutamine methyltransferase [Aestuariirhabdus haliotis]MCL6415197.1 peptide chain release factor N(5)-glutamine methyltransferase [Aestuariirhabdus haliotis]MCL6420072.1 peptide chain release factor N(5)-glutamine methyltransferase [Aestuariirhabdus haliotis]
MSVTIAQLLTSDHGLERISDTARLDLELLLCAALECERSYLFTWPEKVLTVTQLEALDGFLARRREGEPVAHIIGKQGFWSLDLNVDASTLIPRPETELLVELALELLPNTACRVADLGTGSGAIALALASERPEWTLVGVDRIEAAVTLARHNAKRLDIDNVVFVQGSWCDALDGESFDMILSNPPYIDPKDPHLQRGDVRFEPRSALVAQESGLSDIRQISKQARQWLCPGGWLLFEHGFEQAAAVRDLMQALGYGDIETLQDLAGQDRVTRGRWAPATTVCKPGDSI